MNLSIAQIFLILLVLILCTCISAKCTVIKNKKTVRTIQFFCRALPLVVIVLVGMDAAANADTAGFLPQLLAIAVTVAVHLWKRNAILSVFVGTVCYMLLVQKIF